MKLILGICTYPRDYGQTTFHLLKRTFDSLIHNQDLSKFKLKILVVGDDYTGMEKALSPIFEGYDVSFFNINVNDALRDKPIPREMIWKYAVVRSCEFLFEQARTMSDEYDYLMMSSDDDEYINNKLSVTMDYSNQYNQPDFIFSLGRHFNGTILPSKYDQTNLTRNYPKPSNCIAAGIFYNLKHTRFIDTIINYRKRQYKNLCRCIEQNDFSDHSITNLAPEDAQLWHHLTPYFETNMFRSLLIPEVLVNHDTEQTMLQYVSSKR